MASISLKNIKKVYQGKKNERFNAVLNFNLEIKDKEFIVLVGPSGCGKSTTLRMIAGLEEISEGEIKIDDTVINDVAPKDRDIAMVFQNYALYPHMTVYENMAFSLKLRKTPKNDIKKFVHEAANILDIEDLLDRKPKALSGGQRQRVALGRAIVRHPKVFLLDEPLSNLDAKLRAQMRTEISKLHKRVGTTFIYVTHDQIEAMTMADRIVVMKDGIIQQVDTPINIYNNPSNLFVAGFIGSPQMNFYNGVLLKTETDYYIDILGQKFILPDSKNKNGALESNLNQKVILGIRPEDVTIAKKDTHINKFSTTVELSEMMGSELLVHFEFANTKTIAKFPVACSTTAGSKIDFTFNDDKAYIFNYETGGILTN